MGGQTPAQQPLQGAVADAGRAPQGMACGGTESIEGRNCRQVGGSQGGHIGGERNWVRVVELVQTVFREGNITEEATWQVIVLIPKGGEGLTGHRPHGGDVEGSGGDSKSPFHSLHHLP